MSATKKIVITVVIAMLAMTIALIASSLKKLSTEEAGIIYDKHQRILKDKVFGAGLHTGPPGFEFIIFPRIYKTISFSGVSCLNKDGLTIKLHVQFQYLASIKDADLRNLIMTFKDHDNYLDVLRDTAQSVIHDTCSLFNVTQFQTSRMQFQTSIKENLQTKLFADLQTNIGDVQVTNVVRPSAYEQVVRDKETAKQNIIVAERERPRIITQAQTQKKEAETQAQITIDAAVTQARILKTKASSEAEAILNAYKTEANTYLAIMEKQNLTSDGLVSYLTTRAIQSASNPVYVNLEAPAKTNI